jgi:hypothetical protein
VTSSDSRRPLEPLEVAEDRFDVVMCNPSSTWDERYHAAVTFFRRVYFDREDQDASIKAWLERHPMQEGAAMTTRAGVDTIAWCAACRHFDYYRSGHDSYGWDVCTRCHRPYTWLDFLDGAHGDSDSMSVREARAAGCACRSCQPG